MFKEDERLKIDEMATDRVEIDYGIFFRNLIKMFLNDLCNRYRVAVIRTSDKMCHSSASNFKSVKI